MKRFLELRQLYSSITSCLNYVQIASSVLEQDSVLDLPCCRHHNYLATAAAAAVLFVLQTSVISLSVY